MPKKNESPEKLGLVITVNINQKTKAKEARIELLKALALLNRVTAKEGGSPEGVMLRRSARIVITNGEVMKAVQTIRRRDRPSPGVLTEAVISKKQAWKNTAKNARKILRGMLRYADFAVALRQAQGNIKNPVPDEEPSGYYARYCKPFFGTQYRELHQRLLARNRRVDDVPTKTSPVPEQPTVKTEERSQTL